jgi:hypothetical protein
MRGATASPSRRLRANMRAVAATGGRCVEAEDAREGAEEYEDSSAAGVASEISAERREGDGHGDESQHLTEHGLAVRNGGSIVRDGVTVEVYVSCVSVVNDCRDPRWHSSLGGLVVGHVDLLASRAAGAWPVAGRAARIGGDGVFAARSESRAAALVLREPAPLRSHLHGLVGSTRSR